MLSIPTDVPCIAKRRVIRFWFFSPCHCLVRIFIVTLWAGVLDRTVVPRPTIAGHCGGQAAAMRRWLSACVVLHWLFRGLCGGTLSDFTNITVLDHIYLLSHQTADVLSAMNICGEMKAELAFFDTNAEYFSVATALDNYISKQATSLDGVWVRADANLDNCVFMWKSGEVLARNTWAVGETNEFCPPFTCGYPYPCCVRMDWENGEFKQLKRYNCWAAAMHYLCKTVNECALNSHNCSQKCVDQAVGFKCECWPGYHLDTDKAGCSDYNECVVSSPCNHTCTNTIGSYYCSCNGGYRLNADNSSCSDVDECTLRMYDCGQLCENTNGSYRCACKTGYVLNTTDNKSCHDRNECDGQTVCDHICTNSEGSYHCSCMDGFETVDNGAICRDINECNLTGNPCAHLCTNVNGSFICSCKTGYTLGADGTSCVDFDECSSNNTCQQECNNQIGSYKCACYKGYVLNVDGETCEDVDECVENRHACQQKCVNTNGSFSCVCDSGFQLHNETNSCTDIDECANSTTTLCQHTCNNTIGSYYCQCHAGYALDNDGTACTDIDECVLSPLSCPGVCTNTLGSFVCGCPDGYEDMKGICTDVDECEQRTHKCTQSCYNTDGGYACKCKIGYRKSPHDEFTCQDIDECEEEPHPCQHACLNFDASFACTCRDGYQLSSKDGVSCDDIDECLAHTTLCEHTCNNTMGSFFCTCPDGFSLNPDGKSCDRKHTGPMCPCSCHFQHREKRPGPEVAEEDAGKIKKHLKVDNTNMSYYKRGKTSVYDDRPSAETIGCSGLLILCTILGTVVLFDILHACLRLLSSFGERAKK